MLQLKKGSILDGRGVVCLHRGQESSNAYRMTVKLLSDGVSQSTTVQNRMLMHHDQGNDGEENERTNYLPLIHVMHESAQRSASAAGASRH